MISSLGLQTNLVQRLCLPDIDPELAKVSAHFAFGGGIRYGGLAADVMAELAKMFRFDYMGAGQFEDGAVAKSLHQMVQSSQTGQLASASVPVTGSEHRFRSRRSKKPLATYHGVVYLIAPGRVMQHATEFIRLAAAKADETDLDTVCSVGLWSALFASKDHPFRNDTVRGWFELDNDFMFFSDPFMYGQVCRFFRVQPSTALNLPTSR